MRRSSLRNLSYAQIVSPTIGAMSTSYDSSSTLTIASSEASTAAVDNDKESVVNDSPLFPGFASKLPRMEKVSAESHCKGRLACTSNPI
jgi:hypothetical protein